MTNAGSEGTKVRSWRRVAIALMIAVGAQSASATTSIFVTATVNGDCQINAIGDNLANNIIFDGGGVYPNQWRVRDVGRLISLGTGCISGGSADTAFCSSCVTSVCCSSGAANTVVFWGEGAAGNDTIESLNGFLAWFEGGDGNDTLIGGNGADVLTGDDGDDTFYDKGCGGFSVPFFGSDLIVFGNDGFDEVILNSAGYACLGNIQLGTQ